MGPVLVLVFNGFLAAGAFPVSFRNSSAVLSPKHGGDPTKSQPWRPISLLNSDDKLFSSLLVARLGVIMAVIVHIS